MKTKRGVRLLAGFITSLMVLIAVSSCNGKVNIATTSSDDISFDESYQMMSGVDSAYSDETKEPSLESAGNSVTGSTGSNNGGNISKGGTSSTTTSTGSTKAYTNETAFDTHGYEFVIASAWLKSASDSLDTEFETLFFRRKAEVEKLFNCTIKIVNFNSTVSNLQPKILAGNKVADIVEMIPEYWLGAAANKFIIPLDSVAGINVNDGRWISAYTKLANFDKKQWGLQFLKPPEVRSCLFFNKDLLAKSGVTENIYELVTQKKWTFSKFAEISKKCTKYINNVPDTYGALMINPLDNIHMFAQANNGALAKMKSSGYVEQTFTDKEVVNTLAFLSQMANVDKSLYVSDIMRNPDAWGSPGFSDCINMFTSGKVAFLITESWVGNQQLKTKAKKINYGLLPLPIGPDASDYVSPAQNARTFSITSTNKDLKYTIPIFNSLAAGLAGYEGDGWWMGDVQKEYFQDNDVDSVKMYELCLNKSSVDIGVAIPKMQEEWRMFAGAASVFFKTMTPVAAGDSITGLYDNLIDKLFNTK